MSRPGRVVTVTQSNYLPWKGFFDLVRRVDHLVLLDNVQFTRRDWRSRNRIKTPNGVQWLSVPVSCPRGRDTSVSEATIAGSAWIDDHLRALELSYSRTAHFDEVMDRLEPILRSSHETISELNEALLRELLQIMQISIELSVARGPIVRMDPSSRIAELVSGVGGTAYLSAPAARAYLEESTFTSRGCGVRFMEYPEYPEYSQMWPPFRHDVSIVDVLFHVGQDWEAAVGGAAS